MTLHDQSGEKLNRNHFRENLTPKKILKKLRFVHLVNIFDSNTFSENSLTLYLGFQPNLLELFFLKSLHRNLERKFSLNKDKVCTQILTFYRKIVKDSVRIKRILNNFKPEIKLGIGLRKRIALANYNNAEPERDCNFYKIFEISKLRNNLRSFIFNFTSLTLYQSAMIAHFIQDHDPTCQQCQLENLRPAPREMISHIFWDCPKISDILMILTA